MKINITKENFLEGLQIIQTSVASKTTVPILFNFLMEAKDGLIKLTRTDMDIATIYTLKAEVIEEGEITVPLKELSDILKNLSSDKEINIETDVDNKLHIKSGKAKFWVIGTPKSEYPIVPEMKKENTFKIKAKELKNIIENTIFSTSTQETRYVLNGLLWNNTADKFEVVATDGKRLALYTTKPITSVAPFKIIIPSKVLFEIVRLLGIVKPSDDDLISISTSSNQIGFEIKDIILTSRLIEGSFPNYEQVIPTKLNYVFNTDTKELLSSTKRAALCTSDLGGTVKYSLKENLLSIKASSSKMDFSDELKIDYKLDEFVTCFNPQYLIDILKIIDTEQVKFSFTNSTQPVLIEGNNNYKYIIMPIRS